MADTYLIPLDAGPQSASVQLSGVEYRMRVYWRDSAEGCWMLDIQDAEGSPIVNGIPMLSGIDLLGQYRHLGFVGSLGVIDGDEQTYDGLGSSIKLYYVPDA